MVLAIILVTFLIRLIFLKRSIENEKRILSNGGKEFGVENTKRLTLAHIVFYLSCLVEAMVHKTMFDGMSMVGFSLAYFFYADVDVGDSLVGRYLDSEAYACQ
ncbi:membrane protein [Streptococcus pneumoniae]|nr:membrane protein [Streptococcus pneumoniae]